MTTTRTDFNQSWLTETPMGIGSMSKEVGTRFFDTITYRIQQRLDNGEQVQSLPSGIKKITSAEVAHYWHETNQGSIAIAVEFAVKPQALIVQGVAKNPLTGSPVSAADLYSQVLADNHRSIRLLSDDRLSDEGYRIWQRLLSQGHVISVYDQQNPGQEPQSLDSVEDMDQFFKRLDPAYRRWQFVLSESGIKLSEMQGYFATRRMRELGGLGTED